jgi:hypothetical protein
MKIEMKKWEIERIKEIISDVLEFWQHDTITAENSSGHKLSMSTKTFLEHLERALKN